MNKSSIEKDLEINFWRQHITDGLLKARRKSHEIKGILKSNNAKTVLIEKFGFSSHQAQALIELRKPIDEIDEQTIINEIEDLKEIEAKLKTNLS